MAWESRNGKGRYYTRSRKVDGRVCREYIGAGYAGEMAARLDELERSARAAERARVLAERDEMAELSEPMAVLARYADAIARSALMAAGYRQHHRGDWRKRREQNN